MRKTILIFLAGILLVGGVFALTSTQNVIVNIVAGEMQIYAPVQDNIYSDKKVQINLSLSSEAEKVEYSDNGVRWRTLCRNCHIKETNKNPHRCKSKVLV